MDRLRFHHAMLADDVLANQQWRPRVMQQQSQSHRQERSASASYSASAGSQRRRSSESTILSSPHTTTLRSQSYYHGHHERNELQLRQVPSNRTKISSSSVRSHRRRLSDPTELVLSNQRRLSNRTELRTRGNENPEIQQLQRLETFRANRQPQPSSSSSLQQREVDDGSSFQHWDHEQQLMNSELDNTAAMGETTLSVIQLDLTEKIGCSMLFMLGVALSVLLFLAAGPSI